MKRLRVGFAGEDRGYRWLPKKPPLAAGEGVTRHPGADAAEQLSVAGGAPQRNEELSSLAAVLRVPLWNLLIRKGPFA